MKPLAAGRKGPPPKKPTLFGDSDDDIADIAPKSKPALPIVSKPKALTKRKTVAFGNDSDSDDGFKKPTAPSVAAGLPKLPGAKKPLPTKELPKPLPTAPPVAAPKKQEEFSIRHSSIV